MDVSAGEPISCSGATVGAVALIEMERAAREANCRRMRIFKYLLWAGSPGGINGWSRA